MLFNSFDFLLFFGVVFFLQLVLPHRPRNLLLLLASYFFYACWDWRFLGLIWISTIVDYYCGSAIFRSSDVRERKRFVAVSVITNLSILGYFKYAGFFIGSAYELLTSLGFSPASWHLEIVLPVGISFYTFQTLSYSIDIYRKQVKPAGHFLDFALFVAFFPQLVAGPIERAKSFLPQLQKKPAFSWDMFTEGSWLVAWGLFKKVVIADNMAIIVDRAFSTQSIAGGDLLIAVYAFALQIYCDFSGYSDIARGVAKMLGYNLMLNFKVPYFARNPSEFWRRWHISLSSWLRDYLYIPLGGSRYGQLLTYRNLLITMFLGGLWHGAAWTFVLWGLYHGLWLSLHRLVSQHVPVLELQSSFGNASWWLVRVFVTFHLVCLGWFIFRADSISQFVSLVTTLVTDLSFSTNATQWAWQILIFGGPLFFLQVMQEVTGNTNVIFRMSSFARTGIYVGMGAMILAFGSLGSSPFIYFQF